MSDRMLRMRFLSDERVEKVTWADEAVYIRLLLNVDDYGNVEARPNLLRSRLSPTKEISIEEIKQSCARLCEAGLLSTYAVDGKDYFHFEGFEDEQVLKYFHRSVPGPNEETKPKPEPVKQYKHIRFPNQTETGREEKGDYRGMRREGK